MKYEIKTKDPIKVKRGKKSKAAGSVFELRVRKDLESIGWIVSKWQNNVELELSREQANEMYEDESVKVPSRLVPAKPHMVFNPKIKRFIPLQRSSGFPDFIAFKQVYKTNVIDIGIVYDVIGVESKMDGILDKLEKEKCRWLLDNKIFSKILIAEKTKVKNKIVVVYHDFEIKYKKIYNENT